MSVRVEFANRSSRIGTVLCAIAVIALAAGAVLGRA